MKIKIKIKIKWKEKKNIFFKNKYKSIKDLKWFVNFFN